MLSENLFLLQKIHILFQTNFIQTIEFFSEIFWKWYHLFSMNSLLYKKGSHWYSVTIFTPFWSWEFMCHIVNISDFYALWIHVVCSSKMVLKILPFKLCCFFASKSWKVTWGTPRLIPFRFTSELWKSCKNFLLTTPFDYTLWHITTS